MKQLFSFQCQLMGTSQVNVSQLLECHQPLLHGQSRGVKAVVSLHTKRLKFHNKASLEAGPLNVAQLYFQKFISFRQIPA